MFKKIVILILIAWSYPAIARMYQWVDPDTGTTQLSGKPPAWYRSDREGPRVFVFEGGKIIDDTGRQVNDGQREVLRQQAFIKAEQDKQVAKEKLLDATRIKATLDRKQKSQEKLEEVIMEEPPVQVPDKESGENQPDKEKTIEQMQALIRQWEKFQTQNARQLVESNNPDSSDTPPPEGLPPGPED